MSFPVRLLPDAKAEMAAAVDWYEQQRTGLGSAFISRVREVIDRISATPQMHGQVYQDIRKAIVRQFPYLVLYRIEGPEVIVVAIFHSARDPNIWQARV
jgi:toxin ParE1/3/4